MTQAEYLITLADPTQLSGLFRGIFLKGYREPRIAMIGRSNVGKSSLINALFGAPLAQTSKTPGKTKAIHFYLWREAGKIVADLPGYGFARRAHSERKKWEILIHQYFKTEENLDRALVLLDARHGPTEVDREAIEFLSLRGIPVTFVFVKSDTLKTQAERAQRSKETKAVLAKMRVEADQVFWVSSHKKTGIKELVQVLSLKE